jgi:Tfp pilus assembly protein PilF
VRLVASPARSPAPHPLSRLADATRDTAERRSSLLQLAQLYGEGPDDVRDAARAEETLRRLLKLDPTDADAFDRLALVYETGARGADMRR